MTLPARHGLAAGCLFLLVAAGAASGASVDDYRTRLGTARSRSIALRRYEDDRRAFKGLIEQNIHEIERSIPEHETVEESSGDIETDNTWLSTSLDAYRAEQDAKKRLTILNSIDERLAALSDAIASSSTDAEGSKDDDKRRLGDILRRPEYQPAESSGPGLLERWIDAFMKWLGQAMPRPNVSQPEGSSLDNFKLVLQVLVFGAIIGLIGFIFYKFSPLLRFKRRSSSPKRESRVILGEQIADDKDAQSLFGEAEELARSGELRLAIRKGYIALLCELGDRRLVKLARSKTNRDYVNEISGRQPIYSGVSGLTSEFESNWYGAIKSGPEDWTRFRDSYRDVVRRIGSEQ